MDQEKMADVAIADSPIKVTDSIGRFRKRKLRYLLIIGAFILLAILCFIFFINGSMDGLMGLLSRDHYIFYWMLLTGFLAELVAGSMGMGYGVICTTILLMFNIPPPVISSGIHSAESFTTAAGSISHYKMGNVNKKLTRVLAIPAVFGAVTGAIFLSYTGHQYAHLVKPFITLYSMYLGIRILLNAFLGKRKSSYRKKVNIPALGFIGGFIDSFGGGGWGPLVTGTFIRNGRTPRYVIGSSTVAKFILTFASAVTFFITIGIHHWNIVAGLLIGGIVTAPFSALLTSRLPIRKMFFLVGFLVIIMSLITIYKSLFLS
ncbi:MAG: sulfite exporter TauE/SafE family protein [Bacteroidetes bacterium]|nr:sulfite exporter TauE/SafE family protein [Bacteroidota bacterium]MBS1633692.1 sulfite exporter TauE/SafE family protein [Bacteroidota bacterium]